LRGRIAARFRDSLAEEEKKLQASGDREKAKMTRKCRGENVAGPPRAERALRENLNLAGWGERAVFSPTRAISAMDVRDKEEKEWQESFWPFIKREADAEAIVNPPTFNRQ